MELSLYGSAHQNLPKDETDHAWAPPVLPVISPQDTMTLNHQRWTAQSLKLPEVADE